MAAIPGHRHRPAGRHRPGHRHRPAGRRPDDTGGVWIVTGIVLGVLLYGFIVLMDVAGFTPVAPLVVIPPVLLGLIAANNLLRGDRHRPRPPARPLAGGRAPLSSSGPLPSSGAKGAVEPGNGTTPRPGPAAEEPREPR